MNQPLIGWREWVQLEELGLGLIKAKVDTGARTSALHAFELRQDVEGGQKVVHFAVHPEQQSNDRIVRCTAPLVDTREVTDSGGHRELRPVIETTLALGAHRWRAEFTLTDRDTMRFRMLLGRTAMAGRFWVDPARSYLLGGPAEA